MSTDGGIEEEEPRPELMAVADAAGWRLRAETEADEEGGRRAAEALLASATAAMAAGCGLSDIAAAELRGQHYVRTDLRGDTLRRVGRSSEQARRARADHHGEIARAVRLGLSTREIATAAGVTHGTIRAIGNREAAAEHEDEPPVDNPDQHPVEQPHEGGPSPWGEI
jgi:hypothetical protein